MVSPVLISFWLIAAGPHRGRVHFITTQRVGSLRSRPMAEERQLVVDDLFELGQRLSAIQKDPIDKEGWGAGHAHLAALLQVLLDLVFEFAALDARVKQRFIQAQGPRSGPLPPRSAPAGGSPAEESPSKRALPGRGTW